MGYAYTLRLALLLCHALANRICVGVQRVSEAALMVLPEMEYAGVDASFDLCGAEEWVENRASSLTQIAAPLLVVLSLAVLLLA